KIVKGPARDRRANVGRDSSIKLDLFSRETLHGDAAECEDEIALVRDARELLENLDRLVGKRNHMHDAVFRALFRKRPCLRREIEFLPARFSDLSAARTREHEKLPDRAE